MSVINFFEPKMFLNYEANFSASTSVPPDLPKIDNTNTSKIKNRRRHICRRRYPDMISNLYSSIPHKFLFVQINYINNIRLRSIIIFINIRHNIEITFVI